MTGQNILIVGVGGQGVVLAGNILSEAALADGYDVKKTDTLGMAQRGGSVVSHIRFAEKVFSPLIQQGEVDMLIAFEKLEAARWSHYLKAGGLIVINNLALPPLSASLGADCYPDDPTILAAMKPFTENIHIIDGSARAHELGNSRLLNTFVLGYCSLFLTLKEKTIKDTITRRFKPKLVKMNLGAFVAGRREKPLQVAV
jgi:indolepyruvate ferredoxin oxidoreductase beta subunit